MSDISISGRSDNQMMNESWHENNEVLMKIYISVKQAGKRKNFITRKELVLDHTSSTLRELISGIIRLNVTEYNRKTDEPWTIKYLSPETVETMAYTGKVGFDELKNTRRAEADQATAAVMQGFEDGIFRVFIGENEVTNLDGDLSLQEGDVLTFIRLTMLAGRMW